MYKRWTITELNVGMYWDVLTIMLISHISRHDLEFSGVELTDRLGLKLITKSQRKYAGLKIHYLMFWMNFNYWSTRYLKYANRYTKISAALISTSTFLIPHLCQHPLSWHFRKTLPQLSFSATLAMHVTWAKSRAWYFPYSPINQRKINTVLWWD